ncbi:MAG TPA: glycosyltransferase family 2 protein [Burkholderiaceae bacterium]|nr:glycosyltransferase family 2 protein [Burkholderiaceae bacterium]
MSIDEKTVVAAFAAASAHSVLVVIPCLNEARTLEGVLRELGEDLPANSDVQFVVADGGSTDGTVELAQRLAAAASPGSSSARLHVLHNPRRIQSAAVNLAARELGQGVDVLVRCDAHAHYPRGFIASLLATLDRTGCDAVVVPMDSHGTSCFQKAVAWVSNTWAGTGGSAHRGGQRSGYVDHGHHAAFRMASFRRAGGYDESFTHNEDAELDCRQRGLGSRIYLDAAIRLGYSPRATPWALARQYFFYGRGRSRTVRRHPGSMRARQLALPLNLALCLLAVLLAAWQPWLLAWPFAYLAALALTSLAIAWRQRSACGLWAGPAAGLMHVAWALGFYAGLATTRESAWQRVQATPLAQDAGHGVAG